MLDQTTEIQELSLEKVIEIKLVQNNVTEQVLAELKEKYGSLRLQSLDDKEGYLEIKQAAKNCAKLRNLAGKLCKEGREEAVKVQKLWISKEKEVVARIADVEDTLDAEVARFEAEVKRKEEEEKRRQEEMYINRQATLTKMGARYEGGSFVLGEVSFEAELVKGASEDVWEEAVVPKFRSEYEKVEAARAAEEKRIAEEKAEMERQRQELQRQQEEMRIMQEELRKERERTEKAEREKQQAEEAEKRRIISELQQNRYDALYQFREYGEQVNMSTLYSLEEERFNELMTTKKAAFEAYSAEQQRLAEERRQKEIEAAKQAAIKAEAERKAAEAAKRAEELAQASDKEKYADLIAKLAGITLPEMRSGQYRKKVSVIREKIEEILSL